MMAFIKRNAKLVSHGVRYSLSGSCLVAYFYLFDLFFYDIIILLGHLETRCHPAAQAGLQGLHHPPSTEISLAEIIDMHHKTLFFSF